MKRHLAAALSAAAALSLFAGCKQDQSDDAQIYDEKAAESLFAEGQRPFMITGGWASQRLMAMNPRCSYAVCPFPILEDGRVPVQRKERHWI